MSKELVQKMKAIREGLALANLNYWACSVDEAIAALSAKPEHAAEIERLKALLRDAASDLAEWGSYVPEYFVEKHKLDDDIQKYLQAGEKTK